MVADHERLPVERIRFIARGEAAGCGPAPAIGPLTRRQALYEEQYQSWLDWKTRIEEEK